MTNKASVPLLPGFEIESFAVFPPKNPNVKRYQ
jgi:hypothetical protein